MFRSNAITIKGTTKERIEQVKEAISKEICKTRYV